MYTIVGLGNPGEEYEGTRHNTGRIILQMLAKKHDFTDWRDDPKTKSLISKGEIGGKKLQFVLPNNFMNNSGGSVVPLIESKKHLEKLVVVYDDLDLPIGKIKISYDRSSGGHNGLESIIRKLRSQEFLRVRVGIAPVTPGGKQKKPSGEKAVIDFLMKDFKDAELAEIKRVSKKIGEAIEMFVSEGRAKTMTLFN